MSERLKWALAAALFCASCAAPPRPPSRPADVGVETGRRVPEPTRPARTPAPEPIPAPEIPPEFPSAVPLPGDVVAGLGVWIPSLDALLEEAAVREARGDWSGAEALYGEALIREGRWTAARVGLARVLTQAGRHDEVIELLDEFAELSNPEAYRLLAGALEAEGREPEAVWAYADALEGSDEIAADELRSRIRHLIDRMTAPALRSVAAYCPFCAEGGYARLRLAQLDAVAGRYEEAETGLEAIATDFSGDPLGERASTLLTEVVARRVVRPGVYGLLLPLSGSLEPFGRRALRGALLASGLFSAGGDPGIEFRVADTRGDPDIAAQGVEDLAIRGVVGIVGPLKGVAARSAGAKAEELRVPLLALTPAEDVAGGWTFRLYLREEDEVARLVEYAVEAKGLRRFAVVYPDSPMGLRYRELFWDAVLRLGGEITGVQAFPPGTSDLGEFIEKVTGVYQLSPAEVRERFLEEERIRLRRERDLLSALGIGEALAGEGEPEPDLDEERLKEYKPKPVIDFDAVFLPVSNVAAAQMAPQFPFYDVEGVTLLGIRSWNYPALTQIGDEYVEGVLFPAEWHPKLAGAREFAESYREAFGEEPGVIDSYAYDAVRLLMRSAGGFELETRASLHRSLAAVWGAEGVTGPLTSHPGGEIASEPKILTVRRGRIVPVEE